VEYNAAHILVETEEEALAVIETLDGGADFAETARESSTGPSGPSGGDLGWFGAGMMVGEFETAVKDMEPGDISAPVQTQFGWHVIKLNEVRDQPRPTLEQLRPELENQLLQETVTGKLAELTEAAEITRPAAGDFDPEIINNLDLLED